MPDASRQRLLTFDLGTTRLKVALFTRRGRLIGQRAARHIEHRHAGREWQDADQWWADAVRLGRELIARHPGPVAGIAVSGRGGAAVFIGRDGTVIGQPWSDRRHAAQVRALSAWSQSAVPLSNYATALLAKKQWFVANEPVRARQLRHVLYAKDTHGGCFVHQVPADLGPAPRLGTQKRQALDRDLLARSERCFRKYFCQIHYLGGGIQPDACVFRCHEHQPPSGNQFLHRQDRHLHTDGNIERLAGLRHG